MIVFDSSFLVAYHNRRDVHHDAAAEAMERVLAGEWDGVLLLEYVFVETVTVLLARRGLATASRAATELLDAREVEFVPCSDIFLEAFEVFRNQRHSALSFTDAAIVTVARTHEPATVATFDADFHQVVGFTVVPS